MRLELRAKGGREGEGERGRRDEGEESDCGAGNFMQRQIEALVATCGAAAEGEGARWHRKRGKATTGRGG